MLAFEALQILLFTFNIIFKVKEKIKYTLAPKITWHNEMHYIWNVTSYIFKIWFISVWLPYSNSMSSEMQVTYYNNEIPHIIQLI